MSSGHVGQTTTSGSKLNVVQVPAIPIVRLSTLPSQCAHALPPHPVATRKPTSPVAVLMMRASGRHTGESESDFTPVPGVALQTPFNDHHPPLSASHVCHWPSTGGP